MLSGFFRPFNLSDNPLLNSGSLRRILPNHRAVAYQNGFHPLKPRGIRRVLVEKRDVGLSEVSARIVEPGPDWVLPGESALAALGLMSAAQQLRVAHQDTSLYDGVLSRFFQTWLLQNRLEWDVDSRDSDFGGMARLVFYEKSGH